MILNWNVVNNEGKKQRESIVINLMSDNGTGFCKMFWLFFDHICFSFIFHQSEQKPIVFVTLWVECEYLDWHKTCDRWPLIISQIIVYVRRILRTLEYKIVENTDVFCSFDLNEFFLRNFFFALIGESS